MTANPDPQRFVDASEVIDYHNEAVARLAADLADVNPLHTARCCFGYVRDEIRHSGDHKTNPITCAASEVLKHRTGYCYAKSHLLCALLRANQIPAGLCYQRLLLDEASKVYCLHGLNAVFLDGYGWYRVDPRGDRKGIVTGFRPPHERLAFAGDGEGELDLPGIFADPLPVVTEKLRRHETWQAFERDLPDLDGRPPCAEGTSFS